LPARGLVGCRDLRSLPTRRSSDLEHLGLTEAREGEAVERRAAALGALRVVGGVAAEDLHAEALLAQLRHERGGLGAEAGVVDHVDRKSTRLNSSHVKSSYAVLCLK